MIMEFIDCKYKKWYNSIIEKSMKSDRALNSNIYYEIHHIVPKSLGGNNTKDNICILTPKEHFICHWLLTKIVSGENKYKMYKAFHKMTQGHKGKRIFSSLEYDIARKYNSICMKENNPAKRIEVKEKMSKAKLGKKATIETRKKQSDNNARYWTGKESPYKNSKFYNNGIIQKMFIEGGQPEGWIQGRLNRPWNYNMRNK